MSLSTLQSSADITTAIASDLLATEAVVAGVAVPAATELRPITSLVPGADLISDGNAAAAGISASGRYVVFSSDASTLIADDTNRASDIFRYDRTELALKRISVARDGSQNSNPSYNPSISADGRYIAFQSDTTDLTATDDTATDNTTPASSVSGIFVYDDQSTETLERIDQGIDGSKANGDASNAKISGDGRYVAFSSKASNLIASDAAIADNLKQDIFVYDRINKTTELLSVSGDGTQGNGNSDQAAISNDGRYVAFISTASNLVEGDTNGKSDIFVYDRRTKRIERVSVSSTGEQGNGFANAPSISADGRFISYSSTADNLVEGDTNRAGDVFMYDRNTETTERISVSSTGEQANGFSFNHGLSANGQYISYSSTASNLVANDLNNDRDVFVYDRIAGLTERVSVGAQEANSDGSSRESVLSADGQFVAFQSTADNLVLGDRNLKSDIFVVDRQFVQSNKDPGQVEETKPPLGAKGQKFDHKFIDLTAVDAPTVTATINVTREAVYNNTVGFYAVEDDQGSVMDALTGELLQPGDVGYMQAALAQRIDLNLVVTNGGSTTYTAEWATGKLFSSFIVANGTIESLLDDSTSNDPTIFFSNIGANKDGKEHVRLLGQNTFGYEDMVGGGDRDFNDMIVSLKFE